MWRKQIPIIIEGKQIVIIIEGNVSYNIKCKQNIVDSHIYHND